MAVWSHIIFSLFAIRLASSLMLVYRRLSLLCRKGVGVSFDIVQKGIQWVVVKHRERRAVCFRYLRYAIAVWALNPPP